jgi:hypothetical protein
LSRESAEKPGVPGGHFDGKALMRRGMKIFCQLVMEKGRISFAARGGIRATRTKL